MSISEFRVKMGFYDEEFFKTESYQTSFFEFQELKLFPQRFWQSITPYSPDKYEPKQSKSTKIKNPTLRYLHKFVTYSLCGIGDSNRVVTFQDLFHL